MGKGQNVFIDNRNKNDFGVGFTTERWVGAWVCQALV
jgi:hypothetical protein